MASLWKKVGNIPSVEEPPRKPNKAILEQEERQGKPRHTTNKPTAITIVAAQLDHVDATLRGTKDRIGA